MRLFYLPIEAYPERYTELLRQWTVQRWGSRSDIELHVVNGDLLSSGIGVGQVLDAFGRTYWSTTQIAALVRLLRDVGATSSDVIYFDDLFTPGYEAVPYILDQLPVEARPRIFARNHAQSVDPNDFVFPMRRWMRRYEELVYRTAAGVICASTVHAEMMEAALLDTTAIHVLGLPYDTVDVRARGPQVVAPCSSRPLKVVYSSRLDAEKCPHFFMDVVEAALLRRPGIDFVVCTGAAKLRSNDPTALVRLHSLAAARAIRVAVSQTKPTYYTELATARVQLNTAKQDFISYTAIEASTFGTPTLAPAFRSFPETLRNRSAQLYAPWCVDEAVNKLLSLLDGSAEGTDVEWLARVQHQTLDRILAVFRDEPVPAWASQ